MARFDVFAAQDGRSYLLDCQADTLRTFKTRLVVPLLPAEGTLSATRLHPIFEIGEQRVVMVTQLASAVSIRDLNRRIGNLGDEHSIILNAIDMLISGY